MLRKGIKFQVHNCGCLQSQSVVVPRVGDDDSEAIGGGRARPGHGCYRLSPVLPWLCLLCSPSSPMTRENQVALGATVLRACAVLRVIYGNFHCEVRWEAQHNNQKADKQSLIKCICMWVLGKCQCSPRVASLEFCGLKSSLKQHFKCQLVVPYIYLYLGLVTCEKRLFISKVQQIECF